MSAGDSGNGNGGNGLHVTGPGGVGLRASGRDLVFLVLLLAGLAGNAWMIREGLRDVVASNEGARLEFREGIRAVRDDHDFEKHRDQALVCILAVPAAERTTAFRSGDPCAWILSGGNAAGAPPDSERRTPPPTRERERLGTRTPGFDMSESRPRPVLPQVAQ